MLTLRITKTSPLPIHRIHPQITVAGLKFNSTRSSAPLQNKSHTTTTTTKTEDHNDNNSAIVQRFTQILDEKLASSSTITTNNKSIMESDPQLKQLYDKFKQDDINSDHIIRARAYIKSEPLLKSNRHAKDIFESQPWTGKESNYDANLRMIIDSKPKAKPTTIPIKSNGKHQAGGPTIMTPPVSFRDKVINAKESSFEYKLKKEHQKHQDQDDQESSDNFRELYKERLLGPSMLINSSNPSTTLDLVNSLASNKINAAINQTTGQFDSPEMLHVRGKPLDVQHLKNCTDTNYFMNQVLNKQQVLPPWIESQQSLNGSIEQFRRDIDELWFKWLINRSSLSSTIDNNANSMSVVLSSFKYKLDNGSFSFNSNHLLLSDFNYLQEKIRLLNVAIRNYNLQSPSSSLHKFKLILADEIKNSYKKSLLEFPQNFSTWYDKNKASGLNRKASSSSSSTGGILNLFGDDGNAYGTSSSANMTPLYINRPGVDNKLHLWKAIKDIFK